MQRYQRLPVTNHRWPSRVPSLPDISDKARFPRFPPRLYFAGVHRSLSGLCIAPPRQISAFPPCRPKPTRCRWKVTALSCLSRQQQGLLLLLLRVVRNPFSNGWDWEAGAKGPRGPRMTKQLRPSGEHAGPMYPLQGGAKDKVWPRPGRVPGTPRAPPRARAPELTEALRILPKKFAKVEFGLVRPVPLLQLLELRVPGERGHGGT